MSTKHTPGPWAVQRTDTDFGPIFKIRYHSRTDDIAELYADSDDGNAKLIAAAPEMAEALRAIYAEVRDDGEGERPYSHDSYLPGKFQAQICAALAKAGL